MKDKYDDQKISESDNDDIKPQESIEDAKKKRMASQQEGTQKKRKPTKKWNSCVGLQNCILFCFPYQMNQDQLIQDDMEIDIRYLMSTPMLQK